jgi:drug/metabolite transporter (DMT)-like permease
VSALSTSIIILVEIVVAFVISHVFLGESFTAVETVGALMVLAGVLMVLKK